MTRWEAVKAAVVDDADHAQIPVVQTEDLCTADSTDTENTTTDNTGTQNIIYSF